MLCHPDAASADLHKPWSINGIELGDSVESAIKVLSYSDNLPKFQVFHSYKSYCGYELPKSVCGIEASIVSHSETEKFELATELEKPHKIIAIRRTITFNWQEGITPTIDNLTMSLTNKYGTPKMKTTQNNVVTMTWQQNNYQNLGPESPLTELAAQVMSAHIGDYSTANTGQYDKAGTVLIAFITPASGMPHYPKDYVFPKKIEYILYDSSKIKTVNESFLNKLKEGHAERTRSQQDIGNKLIFLP
jgi:hypothetical protein